MLYYCIKAYSELAHHLQSHLCCAGPHTVEVLSVWMDKISKLDVGAVSQ